MWEERKEWLKSSPIGILFEEFYSTSAKHSSMKSMQKPRASSHVPQLTKEPGRVWFGLFILLPKTETQSIIRNFLFSNGELPPTTREKADFDLAKLVLLSNNCLLPTRPKMIPTHAAQVLL